jgi:putative spermidine/putrescine transport system substrate-binding protein
MSREALRQGPLACSPGGRRARVMPVAVAAFIASGAFIAASVPSPASSASVLGAGNSPGSPASVSMPVSAAAATSAAAFGGMSKLIAAAKKEGKLNVITLPSNWVNYGTIMRDFSRKYGIKITDENPEGSSQDELNAIAQLKGTSESPDVVDLGESFAVTGVRDRYWAPYKVRTWSEIPAVAKSADGDYYAGYGGYVAIGYDPAVVKTPPTSFKSLLKPIYKNEVAINGNPTQDYSAFGAVYAAGLANGGSFARIAPGVSYFKKLKSAGNFVPVTGSPATVQSGQTPVFVWWDYLLAAYVSPVIKGFKIVIPADAQYAGFYYQAVSRYAAHPAAARLWEEYLYSVTGQNLWLEGRARPIEMAAMIKAGTINKKAAAALPRVPGDGRLRLPTVAQQNTAASVVAGLWPGV